MALTPYDTGERLEPLPWVEKTGPNRYITGQEYRRPSEPDDFGKVDFDAEDGTTLFSGHIERKPTQGDTPPAYRLVVDAIGEDDLEIVAPEFSARLERTDDGRLRLVVADFTGEDFEIVREPVQQ